MSVTEDPFKPLPVDETTDDFEVLRRKPVSLNPPSGAACPAVSIVRFSGFDLDERPLVTGIADLPGEVVVARSTVSLMRRDVGVSVVVAFEGGDPTRPIILGVLGDGREPASASAESVEVVADQQRITLSAEREVTLRCGDASITLTRAGKILITGKYILSRSAGYNRIKGAAVDIN
jgi:hypothetical protein